MPTFTLHITLGASVVIWLLLCLYLYRTTHTAAWLAASTVASCLFFLGATVAASIMVPGSFVLAPLWLGVLVLVLLHLAAARRASSGMVADYTGRDWRTTAPGSLAGEGESRDGYI